MSASQTKLRNVSVWLPYCGAGATHFVGSLEEVKSEISRCNPEFWAPDLERIDKLAATVAETDYRRMDLYTGKPKSDALPSVQFLPTDYPETRANPDGRTYWLIKPGTIQFIDTNEISVSF